MSERSDAIGLASASAGWPPPNNSACGFEMNDQVTASTMPRAASARLALRVRFWIGVSTAWCDSPSRGNGVEGTRSTPTMRTISSTMSALPATSGRHDGGAIFRSVPVPATWKPRCTSTRLSSGNATSMPASRASSPTGKSNITSRGVISPASTVSDGVPPARSITMRVAKSRPGSVNSGSTPRSKR